MSAPSLDILLEILFAGASIYQTSFQHSSKKDVDHALHREELGEGFTQFKREDIHERKTHLLIMLNELEMHFQQLNSDLISQSRESERDAWDQRSQQLQTMTIAATIMLTALINVLIQGVFEHHTTDFINICYSLSNAGALALLVFSIVLCTEIIGKASTYMYKRSQKFTMALTEARNITKKMMDKVRKNGIAGCTLEEDHVDTVDLLSSAREDGKLKSKWEEHEQDIYDFMMERDRVHEDLSKNLEHNEAEDFAKYWHLNWKRKADAAVLCFYLGTVSMIFANVIFMWEFWTFQYGSKNGAILAVAILIFAAVAGLLIFLKMRLEDNYRRSHRHQCSTVHRDNDSIPHQTEPANPENLTDRNTPSTTSLEREDFHQFYDENSDGKFDMRNPQRQAAAALPSGQSSRRATPSQTFDVLNPPLPRAAVVLPSTGSNQRAAHSQPYDIAITDDSCIELQEHSASDRRRFHSTNIRNRDAMSSKSSGGRDFWAAGLINKRHHS